MQARIIDFASDKFVKSLSKIDKDDVKNFYSTLSSKFGKEGSSKAVKENEVQVEVSGESSVMLSEKSDEVLESSTDEIDVVDDEKIETIELGAKECDGLARGDSNRMKTGEVESFIQKKNLAQGMMDLALVSANCNQLRYVLDMSSIHPYFFTSLALILSSLLLQVVVGVVLLYSNSYNLKRKSEMKSANSANNFSIYGVFLITLTNFLISAFSGTNSNLTVATVPGDDASQRPIADAAPVV